MERPLLHDLCTKNVKALSLFIALLLCYSVGITPSFGQGELKAKPAGSTSAPWGYYEYLPTNYYQQQKHPVIIYLSGVGERGNGTTELSKVLRQGPTKLINNGNWPSSRPFLIFAPQSSSGFFDPDGLRSFINYIVKNYRADATRIYMTGLSAGGISTWNYLAVYRDQIAAAIPICGNGKSVASKSGCDLNNIAIWAFHGSSDPTVHVDGSIIAVANINACSPKPDPLAKLTVYPGVGHDSWSRTYDLSGMNSNTDSKYNPYNISIYDWLLRYTTAGTVNPPVNQQPPVADAGKDISVAASTSKVVLNGSNSHDPDGEIVSYAWKKVSGPSATLSGTSSSQLTITNFSAGTYKLQLTVKDDDGASSSDEVMVTVSSTDAPTASNGVKYRYYEGSWSKLPDFSKQKVVKSGQVNSFDLSPRNRNDNFGFRFDAYLQITTAGTYTFYTSSDDGSKLYLNGKQVVGNDGVHPVQERSGQIYLSVGYHAIKVKYFEKSGGETLTVKYAGPNIGKQNIPNARLYLQQPSQNPVPEQPAPSPPAEDDEQTVVKLYLINPGSNQRVGELKAGSEVVAGSGINIEAVTNPGKVGSVKFVLNGKSFRVESAAPYALGGDLAGNFGAVKLDPGAYTLKAIPYTESKAQGKAGQALEISFKVIKGSQVGINARTETVVAENTYFDKAVGEQAQPIRVYPNPVADKVHIQFANGEAENISYRLLNYAGAGNERFGASAQFSKDTWVIDVSHWNLKAGVYLLEVSFKGGLERKVFRIIKE